MPSRLGAAWPGPALAGAAPNESEEELLVDPPSPVDFRLVGSAIEHPRPLLEAADSGAKNRNTLLAKL